MSIPARSRADCEEMDRADPLDGARASFVIPEGVIYLDGNSLGPVGAETVARLGKVAGNEWGQGLIRSWNQAGWLEAPMRVGDKIAALLGASAGEVVVADSTSVNLFKLVLAALAERPGRDVLLTEEANFPTDLYIAEGVSALLGDRCRVRQVPRGDLAAALDEDVALLMLTHVDFRSGEIHDMAGLTAAAHGAGALTLWDLSHSAGAVPVDLHAAGADLAVGCGYKYLNGGPGAPAYLFVRSGLQERLTSFLAGWMGHADPFEFDRAYSPAAGIRRFLCGTPSILSLAALESAIDTWSAFEMTRAVEKVRALTRLFIGLVDEHLEGHGFEVASPREDARRGGQVSLLHAEGYRVMRALIDRGVVGDYRPPSLLRFGFGPLYTRFVDVWDAVAALRQVMEAEAWRDPAYSSRLAVT